MKLVEKYECNIAGVVLEAARNMTPESDFFFTIEKETKRLGVPLIIDEVTSGFRLNCGGACEYLGIHPDIAVFAKGIANGFPVAAIIGKKKFMDRCNQCGISGIIVPDCPYEEKNELLPECTDAGIEFISMIAPTSHDRIKMIAKEAQGFLYCVSSLGVTGVRKEIKTDINGMIELVKEVSDVPCAVGFGISTPKQAEDVCKYADGAIVGSAIVRIVAEHGKDSVQYVSQYVKEMKDAVRG